MIYSFKSLSPSGSGEKGQPCHKPWFIDNDGLYQPEDFMKKEALSMALATLRVRKIISNLNLEKILCMLNGGLIPTHAVIGSMPNALNLNNKIQYLDYSINREPKRNKRLKKLNKSIGNSFKIGLFEFRKSGRTMFEYMKDFAALDRKLEIHMFGFLDDKYYLDKASSSALNKKLIFENLNINEFGFKGKQTSLFQTPNLISKTYKLNKVKIFEYIIKGVSRHLDDNDELVSENMKKVLYLGPKGHFHKALITPFDMIMWEIAYHQLGKIK